MFVSGIEGMMSTTTLDCVFDHSIPALVAMKSIQVC